MADGNCLSLDAITPRNHTALTRRNGSLEMAILLIVTVMLAGCLSTGGGGCMVPVDRSSPRALAASYQSAASQRDVRASLSCIAPGHRSKLASLLKEISRYHHRLSQLLKVAEENFGPDVENEIREAMLGCLPSPFMSDGVIDGFDLSRIEIVYHGDLAFHEVEQKPVAKARSLEGQWYFVSDSDGYGLWLQGDPMLEAVYRMAGERILGLISEVREGSIDESELLARLHD